MSTDRYHFRLGKYECIAFKDGSENGPTKNLTTSISKEDLARILEESGFSGTETVCDYNCLFIRAGKHQILVDTGWGSYTQRMQGKLQQHLQAEAISAQEISHVILTHGDRDHLAGIIDAQGQLSYPNARYVMAQDAWDWYTAENNLAKMPKECAAFYQQTLPLIRDRVQFIDANTEYLVGVQILLAPGHRPGHLVVVISSAEAQLLHLVDVIPHPIFIAHPQWHWTFDSEPELAANTRRSLLDWAVAEQALIFGAHLPFPGLGHVTQCGDGWRWQPIVTKERVE